MGRWGTGNFDEDTAADHLSEIAGRLVEEVEAAMAGDPVELEPDEYWGVAVPCNLELLFLLKSQGYVGVTLPSAAMLREWRGRFLTAYEEGSDGLDVPAGFRRARREVLERTFDRLIEQASG